MSQQFYAIGEKEIQLIEVFLRNPDDEHLLAQSRNILKMIRKRMIDLGDTIYERL